MPTKKKLWKRSETELKEEIVALLERLHKRSPHEVLFSVPDIARAINAEPQPFKEALYALIRAGVLDASTNDLVSAIPADDVQWMPGAKTGRAMNGVALRKTLRKKQ